MLVRLMMSNSNYINVSNDRDDVVQFHIFETETFLNL